MNVYDKTIASMTKLDDLSDDCLMEVLERVSSKTLIKTQRLNKRFNRLAAVKIRVKIQAISFAKNNKFPDCDHLGNIADDQVLYIEGALNNRIKREVKKRALKRSSAKVNRLVKSLLTPLLAKCTGVKCVDFGKFDLPEGLLKDVFQRLPELRCLWLSNSNIRIREWIEVLDRFGHQLVHFSKRKSFWYPNTTGRFLATVAEKCPNIGQVDWNNPGSLNRSSMAALRKLPKNCRTSVDCYRLDVRDGFGDCFDELKIVELDWSMFSDRVDRLERLKFKGIKGSFRGVEFAGLKKLDISECYDISEYDDNFGCLIASRFPVLEEFCFNSSVDINESDFNELFKLMSTVRKLKIDWDYPEDNPNHPQPYLPRSAIMQLKNLEVIRLKIMNFVRNLEVKELCEPLELYLNEISSLKKLIVKKRICDSDIWEEPLAELVERMKAKQDRVKIVVCF